MYPSDDAKQALDLLESKIRRSIAIETDYEGEDPRLYLFRYLAPDLTRGRSDDEIRDLFDGIF